jgi:hypothetical protein
VVTYLCSKFDSIQQSERSAFGFSLEWPKWATERNPYRAAERFSFQQSEFASQSATIWQSECSAIDFSLEWPKWATERNPYRAAERFSFQQSEFASVSTTLSSAFVFSY